MELYDGERAILQGGPSAMGYLKHFLVGAACFAIEFKYHALCQWYVGLVGLFVLGAAYYNMKCWAYLVTNRRIQVERGFFAKSSGELDINDIRSINVSQTVGARMLGIGTLEFATAAGAVNEVMMVFVNDPKKLKDEIYRCKNAQAAATRE